MKKTLSFAILAGLLLSACAQVEGNLSSEAERLLLRGTIEPATRTTLVEAGEGYALHWVEGDRISVTNGTQSALYAAVSGGDVTTDFTPVGEPLSGDAFLAYYPETLAEGLLPATQNYVKDDLAGMPMLGSSDATPDHLVFRPLCGILKFAISTAQSGIVLSALEVSADQPLSGTVTISGGTLGVTEGAGVTLSCGEGVALGSEATAFHLYVPAGSYTGVKLRLIAADGREYAARLEGSAPYKVVRGELNTLVVAADAFDAPQGERRAVLRPGSDVNELMKQLIDPSAKCTSSDASIRKIVFLVNTAATGTAAVSEAGSEPVWISWDEGTGTVTFTTKAGEIFANVNSAYLFSRLHALTSFEGLGHLNTCETEYFNAMFFSSAVANPALEELDLSTFDTHNAVTFTSMFDSLVNLKSVDLSSFNTAKSRSFSSMFNHCKSLGNVDLTHFDSGNCETMSYMFRYCQAMTEIDLHTWNLSKVEAMVRPFQYCTSLKKLDLGGDGCSTQALTTASHFINASNAMTDMRLGKNFLLENFGTMPELFYQGAGYLQATVEDPFVIRCSPWFAQKSLRNSTQALGYTNQRLMVWKNVETDEYLEFDQEIGSLTNEVTVKGCEAQKVYFDVTSASAFTSVVAEALDYEGSDEPVIRLLADVSSSKALNLTNTAGRLLTLDLNGHVLSGTVSGLISTSGSLVITDSGETKGKVTSTASKVVNMTATGCSVSLRQCVIESTKATGDSWNGDAVINVSASLSTLNIVDSKVYSTKKLSVVRAYTGTVTLSGSEITSGTESTGWYGVMALNAAVVVFNSGSIYTSGTGNSSAFHIGYSAATMTVNGGYFASNGDRTISGGGSYINKMTLNGGYYDRQPSTPSAGGSVSYGSGLSMQLLDPAVQHEHETTGKVITYAYQVK